MSLVLVCWNCWNTNDSHVWERCPQGDLLSGKTFKSQEISQLARKCYEIDKKSEKCLVRENSLLLISHLGLCQWVC